MTSKSQTIDVTVTRDCIDRRKLVYNLARILGLPDEHTWPNRDKFLTIHWDNIKSVYIKISYIWYLKNQYNFMWDSHNFMLSSYKIDEKSPWEKLNIKILKKCIKISKLEYLNFSLLNDSLPLTLLYLEKN